MAVRALLLTLLLALTTATSAIAAPITGGTSTPRDRTGGFGSIPAGAPAPAPPPAGAEDARASSAVGSAAGAPARSKPAHSAQSGDDIVDVPVPAESAPTATPAAVATSGQLPTTGFDLGLFTALGCLSAALGVALLAALGPRRPA